MSRRALTLVLGLLGLALLGAAGLHFGWGDDSLSRLQRAGEIRIGYAPEAPYAFIKPDGEVTGEAPEIAKVVATRLGIGRIRWRIVKFEELIPELEAGRIDVIAAGMIITPERAQQVLFSRPTFRVRQALLVAAGNPLRLHSYRDAGSHPTARIAVLHGSVEALLVRQFGLTPERRVAVVDALTGRAAVESGLADALARSSPSVRWLARSLPPGKTEIAAPCEQVAVSGAPAPGEGAFAFRPADRRLCAAWDEVLGTYLGSKEHRALVAGLGFTPDELPSPAASESSPLP